jgi:tRNA threonylcarbamoyladenosine biosynthesis protein TsaE
MINASNTSFSIELTDETTTHKIAVQISNISTTGDIISLIGDLGSGKTTFARAFINARTAIIENVPSPTFTFLQTYDFPGPDGIIPVYHYDLYRIENIDEVDELGMDDAFAEGISLIEWPEILGKMLPHNRLEIIFDIGENANYRHATLNPYGSWASRLNSLIINMGKYD